jgi:putative tricarboxylic transport membrane protein
MNAHLKVTPGELLISLALIALGSFVLIDTSAIAETQGYGQVGPRLFPYLIGAGMSVCGTWLGWQAITGGWRKMPSDEGDHSAADWPAFAIVSVAVVLHMVLIGWAGFIIASSLLFTLIARAFGSRRSGRDLAIGVALSTAVFFLFTHGLSMSLPGGFLGGV